MWPESLLKQEQSDKQFNSFLLAFANANDFCYRFPHSCSKICIQT